MGTVIDCFIPKEKTYTIEELNSMLRAVYFDCMLEYESLEKLGNYSEGFHGEWSFENVEESSENCTYITGEGGSFFVDIYEHVIHICCLERFSNLYIEFSPISRALLVIFKELCKTLAPENTQMLLVIGGNGETDEILDRIAENQVTMQDIMAGLESLFSDPARMPSDLIEKNWLLTSL
ncbi:hypothetical protein SAMN05216480_11528 [Pustulibacterium marinum]|uniref:Uncharacterized protein n=1 Tax=Pustulibacterium marinum TaxID=1224947 RepID=A0A1I7IDD4_9FLAO|nr:hypothetical protein [Pustulibacterium marinum]SFU70944.1 hypothetical protein SAMN05216480_11528 [Pustulibacterium marinum]